MNIKTLFIAGALISSCQMAFAASETVSLYQASGALVQYCTDANGVQTNSTGVFATGVTPGSCQAPTPTPPPAGNQLLSGTVQYQSLQPGSVNNVNFTLTKNIWGRVSSVDPIHDFPFGNGSTPTITVPANRVIISQFTIPANTTSLYHAFKNVMYFGSSGVTVSFSSAPGDFNPAQTGCAMHNAANSDETMVNIHVQPTVGPNHFFCYLAPGGTYYLNLKFESPTQHGPITTSWN